MKSPDLNLTRLRLDLQKVFIGPFLYEMDGMQVMHFLPSLCLVILKNVYLFKVNKSLMKHTVENPRSVSFSRKIPLHTL